MSVGPPPRGRGARALVVAKAPVAGRVKTRLVPVLGEAGAAALARALLLDTLDRCRAEVSETGVLYALADEREALAGLVRPGESLVQQEGSGLGDALRTGMRVTLDERDAALLVSSDVPCIPEGSMQDALEQLERGADVVLGPCEDGGYWLVGMREAHTEPFRDIPWSTPDVLETTIERSRRAGLTVALVSLCRDVDTTADLEVLAATRSGLGRRTEEFIAQHLPGSAVSRQEVPPHEQPRPQEGKPT